MNLSKLFIALSLLVVYISAYSHQPLRGGMTLVTQTAMNDRRASLDLLKNLNHQGPPNEVAQMPNPYSRQQPFFMENIGQITDLEGKPAPQVRYLLQGRGLNVQLRNDGFSYDTWMVVHDEIEKSQDEANVSAHDVPDENSHVQFHRIDISFKNGNPNPVIEGSQEADYVVSVINQKNTRHIRQFERILYRNIYDGIDIEFIAGGKDGSSVEYNFIIHPGADPGQIELEYAGANEIGLHEGNIKMRLAHGDLIENIPASWQVDDQQAVSVNYAQKESNIFGFSVGDYDRTKTLIIDPTPRLLWGTYFQPSIINVPLNEPGFYAFQWRLFPDTYGLQFMDVDAEGNMYVVHSTVVLEWKITTGAFQSTLSRGNKIKYSFNREYDPDLIIAKFNNKGKLVASTFLGGLEEEDYPVIKVASDGVYVSCYTGSIDMGTLNEKIGGNDILITKFSFNLQERLWSRYVGSSDGEYTNAITVDKDGNLIVITDSYGSDFPTVGALPGDETPSAKIVGAKLSPEGAVLWSGLIARPDTNVDDNDVLHPFGIVTDNQGNIYCLVGSEFDGVDGVSNNFTGIGTEGSYQPVYPGSLPDSKESDILLMKFRPDGTKLWATWVGDKGADFVDYVGYMDLQVDKQGRPWIIFSSYSVLPVTTDALQSELPENYIPEGELYEDILKLHIQQYSAGGDSLLYSTLYTGNTAVEPYKVDISIDTLTNNIYGCILLDNQYDVETDHGELVTDCAHQARAEDPETKEQEIHLFKLKNNGRTKEWGTIFGMYDDNKESRVDVKFQDGKIYVASEFIGYERTVQDATTADSEQPKLKLSTPYEEEMLGWHLACFDEGEHPQGITVSPSSISPVAQSSCVGGLIRTIFGNKVSLTGPEGYVNSIMYQWQVAPTSNGPWKDIEGEIGKNYTPLPRDTAGIFFYRRLTQVPETFCNKITYGISNVHQLTIGPNIAPVAKTEGPKYYTCIGNSITLNGSGSGGVPPYQYAWFEGNDTIPASTTATVNSAPYEPTIYTLRVTDSLGCYGVNQVAVEPLSANAGGDKKYCQGTSGVLMGGAFIQGTPLVSYSWTPSTDLSCASCPRPVAKPGSSTDYTLTVKVKEKSGQVCTMTDNATVAPVMAPNNNLQFGGPDKAVCQGDTTVIGTTAGTGYFYTWAPGSYLKDNHAATTTYDAGTEVVPSPLTYFVTAEKDGCVFSDNVNVFTIYYQITPRNLDQCYGPFWFSQEMDANEKNAPQTEFTWEKTSGDGEIEILATLNGGADAYIRLKPGSGNSVTFRRKATLLGTTCYSFFNTLKTCQGSGGASCYTEVRVLNANGCPLPGGGYKVYAKDVDPGSYTFKWSPSWAFNNDALAIPTVVTTQAVNISVKATNKYDPNIFCVDTLLVNDPALSLPQFAAPDKMGCRNDAIQIGGPPVAGYSFFWKNVTGFQGNVSQQQFVSNPVVKLKNTTRYILRVTDIGTKCYIQDTVLVNISDVRSNAGDDQQACSGSEVTIGAPAPEGTNWKYLWNPSNVPWRPIGTQGQFDPNPTLLFAGNIEMILTATDTVSGCMAKDTVVLTAPPVTPAPPLNTPPAICPGDKVEIGTTPIVGAIYLWSPTTGLECYTCSKTKAAPTTTTTYTLTVSGCGATTSTQVTVTVKEAPEFILTDKENCPSTPLEIGIGATGNTASLSDVKSYSWSPSDKLSCAGCANPTATNPRETEYELTVAYTNGCKVTSTCTITPEEGMSVNAGRDAGICPGEEVTIGMPSESGVTYAWSPTTGLNDPASSNPTASPSATQTYTLTATKGSCISSDQVVVTVRELPELLIMGNGTICRGGETTLGVTRTANYSYLWTPSDGVASPTSPTTIFKPQKDTKYKLTQISNATGCTTTAEAFVKVNEPGFSIDLSSPFPLTSCVGYRLDLPLKVSPTIGNYSYYWSSPKYLDNPFIINPVALPPASTTYKVSVTNLDNNCMLTASIPVKVLPLDQCPQTDFGDVPLAYEKNNPASHGRLQGFWMGDLFDTEISPSSVYAESPANGDDDKDDLNDEDAIVEIKAIHPREDTFSVIVTGIKNDTFPLAVLAAWLDINRDGCFDENELISEPIFQNTESPQVVRFQWTGFNQGGFLPFGYTYLRLRLTGDFSGGWDSYPSPYGSRANGEIEDYSVYISPSLPFPDARVMAINGSINGDLSINDMVPDSTTYGIAVAVAGNPTTSIPVVAPDGTFSFTATTKGVYRFLVPVDDGILVVQVPLVITVLDPLSYAPPVVNIDIAMTRKDMSVTLNTLANDFPGQLGKSLVTSSVTIVTQPQHGIVTVNPISGNITYTPNPGFTGTDTYTYSVSDDASPAGISTGSQFIQIIDPNSANSVLAADDSYCAGAGSLLTGNLLTNDTDPEGNIIKAVPQIVSTPDYDFELHEDGSFAYFSKRQTLQPVTITYSILDDQLTPASSKAAVTFYMKALIGDLVWEDKNRSGRRDEGEPGIEGVKVILHTCIDGVVGPVVPGAMATTDEHGQYQMLLPVSGMYALEFDKSMILHGDKYRFTIPDLNNNQSDEVDSDASMTTGYSPCFIVTGQESLTQYDAGLFADADGDLIPDELDPNPMLVDPQGYFYCENTGEILKNGTISVDGPAPALILHDGSEGFYQFLVTTAGDYTITIHPGPGFAPAMDCLAGEGPFDTMGTIVSFGSANTDEHTDYLDDYSCDANPYYLTFTLTPGAFIANNNLAVSCLDLGDLPAGYNTLVEDDGPRHALFQQPKVFLGDAVDAEADGQPETMAMGDDGTRSDDEDGILVFPVLSPGATANVVVKVNNLRSNRTAKVTGFMDINKDGDFDDTEEMDSGEVKALYSGPDTLSFTVPQDFVPGEKVAMRLRISSGCNDTLLVSDYKYGSLTESDSTFIRPSDPCVAGSGIYYYDTIQIHPKVTGLYSFNANGSAGDTWGILYNSPFDPAQPCLNYIDGDDDTAGSGDPLISATLMAGNEYVLVITTYSSGSPTGDYRVKMSAGFEFQGTIANTDPTYKRPSGSTNCSPGTENMYYEAYTFTASESALHTFDAKGSAGDTYGVLYEAPFIASSPCTNFIASDDDSAGSSDPQIKAQLEAGKQYVFVLTTYSSLDATGAFKVNVTYPLSILSKVDPTGPGMSDSGFECDGEVEDYMLATGGFDYGDLPETYNTSGNDDPPAHFISDDLKLGASVDSELDGKPDPNAGSVSGGDDGDQGISVFGTSSPAGDDEDGVMLVSPLLLPGFTASFKVTAMNMTTASAVLQAWIDFDGNGSFNEGEELNTLDFAGGGATVPVGGLQGAKLEFTVPKSMPLGNGLAMVRFRLSPEGGLEPDTQTGTPPIGEIEDYVFDVITTGFDFGDLPESFNTSGNDYPPAHRVSPDLKLGASVDSESTGIPDTNAGALGGGDDGNTGVIVYGTSAEEGDDEDGVMLVGQLTIPGDTATLMVTAMNMTNADAVLQAWVDFNGNGSFDDDEELNTLDFAGGGAIVPVGGFQGAKLDFLLPSQLTFDSGLARSRFRLSPNGGLEPDSQLLEPPIGEIEDYAFPVTLVLDYGDLPETYNTSGSDMPPSHTIIPELMLGTSVDGEVDGNPDVKAGALSGGDDGLGGFLTYGTASPDGDDEDGIMLVSPLFPGSTAYLMVTALNKISEDAVLQAWFDFDGNGSFGTGEELNTLDFANGGLTIPVGGLDGAKVAFTVPATMSFDNSMVMARFRLSPAGNLEPDAQVSAAPFGEIEDYAFLLARLGNLVWYDRNNNGKQEEGEPGLDSVKVTLVWAGPDGNMNTEHDNTSRSVFTGPEGGFETGKYSFDKVPAGQYKLIYEVPAGMLPTKPNVKSLAGADYMDSDGASAGFNLYMVMETFAIEDVLQLPRSENGMGDAGPEQVGSYPDRQHDETHDMGFWNPCCSDLLNHCCPSKNK